MFLMLAPGPGPQHGARRCLERRFVEALTHRDRWVRSCLSAAGSARSLCCYQIKAMRGMQLRTALH